MKQQATATQYAHLSGDPLVAASGTKASRAVTLTKVVAALGAVIVFGGCGAFLSRYVAVPNGGRGGSLTVADAVLRGELAVSDVAGMDDAQCCALWCSSDPEGVEVPVEVAEQGWMDVRTDFRRWGFSVFLDGAGCWLDDIFHDNHHNPNVSLSFVEVWKCWDDNTMPTIKFDIPMGDDAKFTLSCGFGCQGAENLEINQLFYAGCDSSKSLSAAAAEFRHR